MRGGRKEVFGVKRKAFRWRFFYYGDTLNKVLRVNRGDDEVIAWCFDDMKQKCYVWSDVQRRGYPAMSTREVASFFNRTPRTIEYWLQWGHMDKPKRSYDLNTGNPGRYRWSRDDVMALFEVVRSIHYGHPNKSGEITHYKVPNEREVRAAMMNNLFVYGKKKDGDFVPIWESELDHLHRDED